MMLATHITLEIRYVANFHEGGGDLTNVSSGQVQAGSQYQHRLS